jgi:uncharacterized membrane protein
MLAGRRLQLAAVVVLFIVYSGLSHYSNSQLPTRDWGTALALAPMLGLGLLLIWRWSGALAAILGCAAAALLLRYLWPRFTQNFSIVYLLQQCGFYAIMAASFGRTLRPGATPLCTQLAAKVHGPLSALELSYTRRVTWAWTIFFWVNVAAEWALFEFAPLRVWSLFANFLALPLIALMFVAEYAVRRRLLPRTHPRGLMATLRVYFANPQ